ncbi:MAG: hypothetical protein WCS87_18715 [Methylococcaceae bacterium]
MSLIGFGIGEAVGGVAVGGGMAVQGAATVLSKLQQFRASQATLKKQ